MVGEASGRKAIDMSTERLGFFILLIMVCVMAFWFSYVATHFIVKLW